MIARNKKPTPLRHCAKEGRKIVEIYLMMLPPLGVVHIVREEHANGKGYDAISYNAYCASVHITAPSLCL